MNNDSQANNQSKKLISKAISFASMGFTAFQVFGHQQKAQAAESSTNSVVAAANEQIATVNAEATEHIANVASTVDMVNAAANADIAYALAYADAANSLVGTVDVSETVNEIDIVETSSDASEVASSVINYLLDWF
jgi:hypothetical protein